MTMSKDKADKAKQATAKGPTATDALRQAVEVLDGDGEVMRRASNLIRYVWGEHPPFKDLADVLDGIQGALAKREELIGPIRAHLEAQGDTPPSSGAA